MSARSVSQLVLIAAVALLGAAPARAAQPFVVTPGLAGQVQFWKLIFTTYDQYQILVHDTEDPSRVYSVLDFRSLAESGLPDATVRAEMNKAEENEKRRIRGLLTRLHSHGPGRDGMSVEELRIRSLFDRDPHVDRFLLAAGEKRIRGQRGIRGRFLQGVQRSQRYLSRMEPIFRAERVPVEVTRLPLIESSFNTHAYSKVGAAGMWQFMPSTGRLFLTISPTVDERLDPFASTRAAARFLRQNYDRLGTWPLAITAYNHGPGGMARAVRDLGTTEIEKIIARYKSDTFGFASRNFYPEFLAALDVERRHADYFGPVALDPPMRTDDVELRQHVALDSVLRCASCDEATIKALNPALLPAAFKRYRSLPSGYELRLPPGAGRSFDACHARLPEAAKPFSPPPSFAATHRVRRGETLAAIARRHGVSADQLRRRNGLRSANLIRVGQVLKIPDTRTARTTAPAAAPSRVSRRAVVHRVERGQTLQVIARRYGRSVESLRRHNDIGDRDHIRVGQVLSIPAR